ncbi:hypothetical protein TanjilG_08006 [Lupinus angustifolius]|uniref:TF-B3 domain-containing protein n=1 Tax=Lupinus angustifolius TaxID=3871 RepID=A0A4P1RM20_LUPAN|nr:hypothetical protein TanjilG_08006 [Lupinus angustifolius]
MASASSSSSKLLCFNPHCNEFKSERPNKGWRLRNGDLAELCDRCGSAFEEGRFCDIFHSNASGWRNCETCRKGIHCGCIVSCHAFVLLDHGEIECFACARKHILLQSNPKWPSSFSLQNRLSERLRDLPAKNWSQLAGSGHVSWKQAPNLFNSVSSSDLHPYVSSHERLPASSLENKNEDLCGMSVNWSANFGPQEMTLMNGFRNGDKSSSCLNICQQPLFLKEDSSPQPFAMSVPYATPNERNGQIGVAGSHPQQTTPLPGKQFSDTLHLALESSPEAQVHSGRPQADARERNQLLQQYWPRCTDLELQQITTLSASDAGRIGRLVLPKKCAEAYFPSISQPEGLPLKVLDAKGKEWTFQFRFWPNNNSRMYVLEGVTPCIQSMQLQAGDTVTFSRLEPEGRLVMGFRRATNDTPTDQDNETSKTGNGFSALGEVELADPSSWSKIDKSGYIAKEVLERKSSIRKRKSSMLGSKSKHLKIENQDLIELKITWQEAQGLLRPPPSHVASIVVIEGFEFEEYEDAPVLGKPTIFTTDNMG